MAWIDLLVKLTTIVGVAVAALTFWRSVKVRRAEWLSNLHGKFFEAESYKRIRRVLDSNDTDTELLRLQQDIESDQTTELVEAFVDYLNFFEFVASLRKLRQLKTHEIAMLFDYYLRLLCRHAFARSYVRKNGFEELESLLTECVDRRAWK